jgi:hypothetical protein
MHPLFFRFHSSQTPEAGPDFHSFYLEQGSMPSSTGFFDLLEKIFGDVNHIKLFLQETRAIIVTKPIIQKRLTIYIPHGVFGFLWHDLLTEEGYLSDNVVRVAVA